MAEYFVNGQQQNVSRVIDGSQVRARALRDGALITVPWYEALVAEGRVFHTVPLLTATGAAVMVTYADTSKSLYADIPDGTAFIPIECRTSWLATGNTGPAHMIFFVSDTLNGTGGTETAATVLNLRRDSPLGSTATAAYTADSEVDTVTGAEISLLHRAIGIDVDSVGIDPETVWSAFLSGIAPIGLDAGSINIVQYYLTNASTAFYQMTWAELPESVFV